MRCPGPEELSIKLAQAFSAPIVLVRPDSASDADMAEQAAPWRTAGHHMCDLLVADHCPKTAGAAARGQIGLWGRYSAFAAGTAVLRLVAPGVAAWSAYHDAVDHQAGAVGRVLQPALACAASLVISLVGVGVNGVQVVLGLIMVAVSMGLSGYYFAQMSLKTFLPPKFVLLG